MKKITNFKQPKIYIPPRNIEKKGVPKYAKILILFFIFLVSFIYLIIFSPLCKIKKVEIIGNLEDGARAILEETNGSNIFLLDSKKIENTILGQYPSIELLQISMGIPSTLRIKIIERKAKIIWQTSDHDYLVDEKGCVYEAYSGLDSQIAKVKDIKDLDIKIPSQIATNNFVNFVVDINLKYQNSENEISHFEINETIFQVTAVTKNDLKIILDTTRPLSEQVDAFDKVYQDNKNSIKEYVDVRVEGLVYYK